ncbi:MAG: hypothetical protein MUC88_23165 [Planctomycetes bacterium]|jgi:hypothetical protein|nr:hypothetical protein [Planctomycetota bacterium]
MRTGLFIRLAVTTLVSAIAAGCQSGGDAFRAEFTRREELTGSVAGITMLDIRTDIGKIHLYPADVEEVRVKAEIKVKAATEERAEELAERVRIVLKPSGETLAIQAVEPTGFGHDPLWVDFTITAPAGLALTCSTNIGDIRAEYAPEAPVAIHLDASTNVGSIELAGPKDISAKLVVETNVGSIDTDRPLTVMGNLKRSISTSLGSAEGRISLRTDVGSIRIR